MSTGHVFDAAELPLSGLRLIEASAGTGKTFSLAGLYLRLIVEARASVRDVLVMTFTRAATQELRDRIRARLAQAALIAHDAALAREGHPEDDFTRRILERVEDEEEPAALARRLADAAARVDEATIVTIHGFAQRAATENAFESALAFDRGEAVDDAQLYREAAADYWREHVFGADAAAGDVLAIWPTPDALYDTIGPVLSRTHTRLAGIDTERLAELQAQLTRHWPGTAAPLAEALAEAFDNDALKKNDALAAALAAHDSPHDAVAVLDQQITAALANGAVPALGEWVTTLAEPTRQFKKTPKSAQAYAAPLADMAALPLLAEIQPLARLVAIDRAVAAVRERAAARKIARRQYSYDDLIIALHAALTDERTGDTLADALHARWPYALVDEFQDTDPLQYASLSRIYLARPRDYGALLLIGDPKQAIYGFRGGDIYAYLAAARAAGDARYTLTTNFRSTQRVLDAIEALYRAPGEAPFVVPDIDFPHVEAGRHSGDRRLVANSGQEQAALTFWQLHGGEKQQKNGKTKNPSKSDDNARLVDETVAAIAGLLYGDTHRWQNHDGTTQAVAARDIAVLVNNRHEATALQAALASAGIRAVCQHRELVFESAEAADLRLILRAMAQPDDAMAVRAAQPTALIGKRLTDLIALADDDHAMQVAIERFHALHDGWRRRGVLAALEELFVAAAPGLLAQVDGERRLSNVLQLGELLAGAEAECFGMASLIRWLDDHIAAAKDNTLGAEDESQLRLESDAELVRISTVHAAKGLEYPIVFLPFGLWLGTWSDRNRPDKPPLVFHGAGDTPDSSQAYIDLVGNAPAHIEQAVIEARSEALRLLYVALTRAREALIVGWREPDDTGAAGALGDLLYRHGTAGGGAPRRLAEQQPQAIAIEPIDVMRPAPAPTHATHHDAVQLGSARSDLPATRPRWSTYSFSRLAHAPVDTAPAELPEPGAEDELATQAVDTPEDEPAGELPRLDDRLAGVRFGSAVHDLLENQLQNPRHGAWPTPGQALAAKQRQQVYDVLRQYGLIGDDDSDRRIDDSADLVARTLHTPLPGIGALDGLDRARLITEMEFMLRLSGPRLGAVIDTLRAAGYLPAALGGHAAQTLYGLMQGFIDLVVEVDGAYVILDYKTNRLGDTPAAYRHDALGRAIGRAHYDLQYLIYTVALHRHLRRCLPDYDPAVHLGGVQYLFVRAMDGESDIGVFTDRPDVGLVAALDALFDGQTTEQGMQV